MSSFRVFFSGNGPLVKVLCEALAPDRVQREKDKGLKLRKGRCYGLKGEGVLGIRYVASVRPFRPAVCDEPAYSCKVVPAATQRGRSLGTDSVGFIPAEPLSVREVSAGHVPAGPQLASYPPRPLPHLRRPSPPTTNTIEPPCCRMAFAADRTTANAEVRLAAMTAFHSSKLVR